MENILQIADLTKRYPDFYLDHLTLNVPSGSIVGLIGENGAGKTTIMNLILNAVTKDSGDILVFGQDMLYGAYNLFGCPLGLCFQTVKLHRGNDRRHHGLCGNTVYWA